jgi:hypothetical protein
MSTQSSSTPNLKDIFMTCGGSVAWGITMGALSQNLFIGFSAASFIVSLGISNQNMDQFTDYPTPKPSL